MRLHVLLLGCAMLLLPVAGPPAANASGECVEVTWNLPESSEEPTGCKDGALCVRQNTREYDVDPEDPYYVFVDVCLYG